MLNKYKLEYILFVFFGRLLTLFGFNSIKYSSRFLAFLFYYVLQLRKKVVIKNLTKAFPNLTRSEISKLALKNYLSIAITFLEVFKLKDSNPSDIRRIAIDKNLEQIDNKFKEGKGLILLTAHLGNWELGAIAAGVFSDHSISVLIKNQKNPYVKKWLIDFREKFGNKQIPVGASIREILVALKNKEIVGIVGDQRGPRGGQKVNFFGEKTSVFTGTASIALKTKCNVIIMFCVRNKMGVYELVSKEIITSTLVGSNDEQILQFNQEYMSFLESVIRQYPEQWFWMHNIWKY